MRDADRRVRNLTEAIANGGWNDSVAVKLKTEEARLATLKAQVAIANQQKPEQALPNDEVIRQQLWNLMRLVNTDPLRGREALARCLRPFVLTPEGEPTDRHYRATGALNLPEQYAPLTMQTMVMGWATASGVTKGKTLDALSQMTEDILLSLPPPYLDAPIDDEAIQMVLRTTGNNPRLGHGWRANSRRVR